MDNIVLLPVAKSEFGIDVNDGFIQTSEGIFFANCGQIVGGFLWDKNRQPLDSLARSSNLWERRIAMMATFYFIRRNNFADTLRVAEILLNDKEDLIHKAVGWMLRETGKRNLEIELEFLCRHYREMPRTMLRYAIEKFPPVERQKYLKGEI